MIEEILEEAEGKMKSTLSVFRDELSRMRSGRASTALVDRMTVEYYGQDTELRQLASISTPEAMQILIRPYDKGSIRDIERAIQKSDIGVNPNVDGENIRLNMPALTRESEGSSWSSFSTGVWKKTASPSATSAAPPIAICRNLKRKS